MPLHTQIVCRSSAFRICIHENYRERVNFIGTKKTHVFTCNTHIYDK